MHKQDIGVIVLAAGGSTRMGAPKQLIKIGGDSLIRRAVQTAIGPGDRHVAVVLGANVDLIRDELNGLDFIPAINFQWQEGMGTSIVAGLSALLRATRKLEGVVIMLADQPLMGADALNRILEARNHARLVAACYKDTIGTPAFFAYEYFDELLNLRSTGGAKTLLERHRHMVLSVDMPEAELDLDTPEDVAAFELRSPAGSQFVEGCTRRQFITNVTLAGVGIAAAPAFMQAVPAAEPTIQDFPAPPGKSVPVKLRVNGADHNLQLDPRVTLLDALREHLGLTGSKKGCDHGQCGACTVLVNGRRINSCLALAVVHEGEEITTIEGLAKGPELHPVQAAFLEQDGFQCGYCTPGQICSAVALLKEGHAKDDAEIREWMSGNICRCGAYTNIVSAIREAKAKSGSSL